MKFRFLIFDLQSGDITGTNNTQIAKQIAESVFHRCSVVDVLTGEDIAYKEDIVSLDEEQS